MRIKLLNVYKHFIDTMSKAVNEAKKTIEDQLSNLSDIIQTTSINYSN
jgi:hypothetical protein